jgi:hypothetical protein
MGSQDRHPEATCHARPVTSRRRLVTWRGRLVPSISGPRRALSIIEPMTFPSPLERRHGALLIVGAACALAGLAAGVLAAPAKQMVLVPSQDVKFVPIDPARPDEAAYAVLRGDPARGPSAMLLRFGKGSGALHHHSSDYELVLLEGTMKHRTASEPEAAARPLGPGSYWFQPGKQVHADSCLTDECLMFVSWAGKRDSVRAEPPAK